MWSSEPFSGEAQFSYESFAKISNIIFMRVCAIITLIKETFDLIAAFYSVCFQFLLETIRAEIILHRWFVRIQV